MGLTTFLPRFVNSDVKFWDINTIYISLLSIVMYSDFVNRSKNVARGFSTEANIAIKIPRRSLNNQCSLNNIGVYLLYFNTVFTESTSNSSFFNILQLYEWQLNVCCFPRNTVFLKILMLLWELTFLKIWNKVWYSSICNFNTEIWFKILRRQLSLSILLFYMSVSTPNWCTCWRTACWECQVATFENRMECKSS